LMKQMRDNFGITFIFSTHDTRIIGEAETIYSLEDGRLLGREGRGGANVQSSEDRSAKLTAI
jgi:putative ABC transport system ATP-binding protein